jgi:hypothetical protein
MTSSTAAIFAVPDDSRSLSRWALLLLVMIFGSLGALVTTIPACKQVLTQFLDKRAGKVIASERSSPLIDGQPVGLFAYEVVDPDAAGVFKGPRTQYRSLPVQVLNLSGLL